MGCVGWAEGLANWTADGWVGWTGEAVGVGAGVVGCAGWADGLTGWIADGWEDRAEVAAGVGVAGEGVVVAGVAAGWVGELTGRSGAAGCWVAPRRGALSVVWGGLTPPTIGFARAGWSRLVIFIRFTSRCSRLLLQLR